MAKQSTIVTVNGITATVDLDLGTASLVRDGAKWTGHAGWIDGVRIGPRPYGKDPCAVFGEAGVRAAEAALSAAL
jgi:hypothetical protein